MPSSPTGDGVVSVNSMIKRFTEDEKDGGNKNVFAEDVLANLSSDEATECPICLDVMENPVLIPECMHQWYSCSQFQ